MNALKEIGFPWISSRRDQLWALVGVGALHGALISIVFSVVSPFRAFVAAAAIPWVVAILLSPHLGLYILAACASGQWPWNLMRYVLMLVTASTSVWLLVHRKPLFQPSAIFSLVGMYVLVVLASTIHPLSRGEMWSETLAYVGHFALVWIVATLIDTRHALRRVVWLMVFSGVVISIVGLIQARTHFIWPASSTYYAIHRNSSLLGDKSGMELQGWMGHFRVDSITGTPDLLPLYLQTLLPFIGFWIARQQSRARQTIGILILLLFGVVHLLSFTRGAMLTTAVVLLLMSWAIDKRRFVIFGPTLVLVGFFALLIWEPTRERVMSMVSPKVSVAADGDLEPMKWRMLMLPVGVKMLLERPILGMGVGQQRYNWPASAKHLIPDLEKPVQIHNSYLQAGIELGLGGLAVLVTLMVTTIRRLQSLAKHFESMGERELADTARASLIAFIGLASAMFAYPMLENFRYFWVLIGLACALVRLERELHQVSLYTQPSSSILVPATGKFTTDA